MLLSCMCTRPFPDQRSGESLAWWILEDHTGIDAVRKSRNVCFRRCITLSHQRVRGGFGLILAGNKLRVMSRTFLCADIAGHDDDGGRKSTSSASANIHFMICKSMLNAWCAFSISSSRITEYGLRVTASVTPPSRIQHSPRRTNQSRNGVAFHELAHVDLDQMILATEDELCQHPR